MLFYHKPVVMAVEHDANKNSIELLF